MVQLLLQIFVQASCYGRFQYGQTWVCSNFSVAKCQLWCTLSTQQPLVKSAVSSAVGSIAPCYLLCTLSSQLQAVSCCNLWARLQSVSSSGFCSSQLFVSEAASCQLGCDMSSLSSVSWAAYFPAQLWHVSLAAIWQVCSNAEVSALTLYISCLQEPPIKTKAAFLVAMIKSKMHAVTVRCIYNLKSTLCLGHMSSLLHDIHDTIHADSSTADGYSWYRGWAELGSSKHQDGCLQCCTCAVHISHGAFAVQKTKCCVRAEQIQRLDYTLCECGSPFRCANYISLDVPLIQVELKVLNAYKCSYITDCDLKFDVDVL